MFDFSAWLMESLVSGVQKGLFAREFVAVKVADYLLKGVLTPAQAEQIATDAVYVPPQVPVMGAPFDEPMPEPIVEIDPETGLPVEVPEPEPIVEG